MSIAESVKNLYLEAERYKAVILEQGTVMFDQVGLDGVIAELIAYRLAGQWVEVTIPKIGKDGTVYRHILWNQREGRFPGEQRFDAITYTARPISRQIVVKGEVIQVLVEAEWSDPTRKPLRVASLTAHDFPRDFRRMSQGYFDLY